MGALETLQRRRLTIDEYHRAGDAGVLGPSDRVELIGGEMIEMAPIGAKHFAKVNRLSRMLGLSAGNEAIVSTQNPLSLPPYDEPQPDIALLKPRADDYEKKLPAATDVLLIVEVADSTLKYDREVKLPIYARHGIVEVWLIDIRDETLLINRSPGSKGFKQVLKPRKNGTVTPLLLPNVTIDLAAFWR
jgi:Uma2 family endonuclease